MYLIQHCRCWWPGSGALALRQSTTTMLTQMLFKFLVENCFTNVSIMSLILLMSAFNNYLFQCGSSSSSVVIPKMLPWWRIKMWWCNEVMCDDDATFVFHTPSPRCPQQKSKHKAQRRPAPCIRTMYSLIRNNIHSKVASKSGQVPRHQGSQISKSAGWRWSQFHNRVAPPASGSRDAVVPWSACRGENFAPLASSDAERASPDHAVPGFPGYKQGSPQKNIQQVINMEQHGLPKWKFQGIL